MPIIDLDRLTSSYHYLQARRIEALRRRIRAQTNTLSQGLLVPSPENLPIGKGRRLEAAILFLDISKFTSRPSETQAEQDVTVRCLSFFFTEIVRIIEDYGGTVEKNTGDGVMAYFSRRSGPGDPRKRAVACAMTIFYAGDSFINPAITASGIAGFSFRICIDFGWVTIARMGAAQRFNHIVAVGTTANRTSKMLRFADGGDILIGEGVLGGLPTSWVEKHVELSTSETGWAYPDGTPYPFYRYEGRWLSPVSRR